MQIVIDIPEEDYEYIKKSKDSNFNVIKNGILLPKGHGRLIDEKDVMKIYDSDARVWWENALDDIKEFVPTIIEADKENE